MYNINIFEDYFQWDDRKAITNFEKHGVSFEEAATIFLDGEALIMDDPDHSAAEDRFVALGLSLAAHVLVVCYCLRVDGGLIRIISARLATHREETCYWRRKHEG